jgi:bacterioferritin-associated ferredoxin
MYVCVCAAVTEARVRACIDEGAGSADEVGRRCGAGTGCGSCLDRLEGLIDPGSPPGARGYGPARGASPAGWGDWTAKPLMWGTTWNSTP